MEGHAGNIFKRLNCLTYNTFAYQSKFTGWSKKADTRFIFAITLSILVDLQFFSLLQTAVNFQQNQY